MIVKVSVLRFHPGRRDQWLDRQPVWNRAKHRTEGFLGADILLRIDDPHEAVTYARWVSTEAERRFMEEGGKECYEATQVGSLLAGESWEYYDFDHACLDRRAESPIWKQNDPYLRPPDGNKPFVKLLTLKMKRGMLDRWLEKQPFWSRAMADSGGFIGGDVLRRRGNPDEALLCARWVTKAALDHFMKTGAPFMMVKTGVGDLFEAEIGRNYELDHRSHERQ